MTTKYRVIAIKDTDPEKLMVIGVDFVEAALKSVSKPMSEEELRNYLKKAGCSEQEIDGWIGDARQYPVA